MVVPDLTFLNDLPPEQFQAILNGPALKNPYGQPPNFDAPNQNGMGYAIILVLSVFALVMVICQLWSRVKHHGKVLWEDLVAVAALAAYAVFNYYTWRVIRDIGLYVHQWDVRLKQMPDLLYNVSAASATYGCCITALKVGILLQWTRLFVPRGVRNMFWWVSQATLGINFLFYFICTFIEIFGCSPRRKAWIRWTPGKCVDLPTVIIVASFMNFFSDLIILILPQWTIWHLKMSPRKKIGTGAIFAIGVFANISAAMRIKYSFDFANTADLTWVVCPLGLWAVGEMAAGFCVLCLPSLPKLLQHSPWIQKIVSAFRSVTGGSSGQNNGQEDPKKVGFSWPRSKPRKNPDASLFTDTSRTDFIEIHEAVDTHSKNEVKFDSAKKALTEDSV